MATGVTTRPTWRQDWTIAVCIGLIALGVIFRFGNLNQVYWHDETFTALRMSGYTAPDVKADIFNGTLVTVDDLMYYQWPNEERTVVDTVDSLIIDDPQHPPVYYVLIRQWVAALGNSIGIARSLSVFISLLSFPAMYWFCQELFTVADTRQQFPPLQRQLTSLFTTVLLALSPFHVLYSQEAREYALWTVLILTLNAVFLRAIRHFTGLNWIFYTGLLVTSLYTHPFTGFFALGHGVYLLAVEKFRPSRQAIAGCLAIVVGLSSFIPWAWILLRNSFDTIGLSWTSVPLPFSVLLKVWGLHVVRGFFLTRGDFGFDTWQVYVGLPLALLLIAYSLYFICRHTPWRFWLFVLLLISSSCLPLILPDLILGGQRSTAGRYLVPTVIGVQIAIATVLMMQSQVKNRLSRRCWRSVTAIVLMLAIVSNFSILKADSTWPKFLSYGMPEVARIVNKSPDPLVISSSDAINFGSVFSLSHAIDLQAHFLLFDFGRVLDDSSPSELMEKFEDVFLLNPSDELRESVEKHENAKAELIFNDFHLYLWQLR